LGKSWKDESRYENEYGHKKRKIDKDEKRRLKDKAHEIKNITHEADYDRRSYDFDENNRY